MKTTGPCMSLDARGTVGGAITYSKAGGRCVAKKKSNPKQPNTTSQLGARAFMQMLIRTWSLMPTELKGWWETLAASSSLPTYQFYLRENMRKFNLVDFPGWGPAPVEEGDQPLPAPYPWAWFITVTDFAITAEYDSLVISAHVTDTICCPAICVLTHNDEDGILYWNSMVHAFPLFGADGDSYDLKVKCRMPLGTYKPLVAFLNFWSSAPVNEFYSTELTFTAP